MPRQNIATEPETFEPILFTVDPRFEIDCLNDGFGVHLRERREQITEHDLPDNTPENVVMCPHA
ncbi:hypothetical protein K7432_004174 [Basidiobolus ranarum]|uniref:Uncharacterized protein n=1 Tax=Basidiobolus ranarum TaxID=34480 RepID=A0ABR2W5Z7_9FUNG